MKIKYSLILLMLVGGCANIESFKQTCRQIGFEDNTEPFMQCVLTQQQQYQQRMAAIGQTRVQSYTPQIQYYTPQVPTYQPRQSFNCQSYAMGGQVNTTCN